MHPDRHSIIETKGIIPVQLTRIQGITRSPECDQIVVEEPLEIRLSHGPVANRRRIPVSVTMRTPGQDRELALGLMFSEGLISEVSDVVAVETSEQEANVIRVDLHPNVPVELARLERYFPSTSSCGLCGKSCLEAVESRIETSLPAGPVVRAALIHELPTRLLQAQAQFARSGGLHAAAIFDATGRLLDLQEDIGRHNALDKLIGASFESRQLPWHKRMILISGRASFELVQKAAIAGAPIVASVGAPSSLAIDLAKRCGMTLLGFVRDNRFNIYSGENRILDD